MGYLDRIEIEFTSDVPIETRDRVHNSILASVDTTIDQHVYEMVNTTNGAHRIEITAHDRTTFDLTDGQVVERLRETAKSNGVSVQELLRKMTKDA